MHSNRVMGDTDEDISALADAYGDETDRGVVILATTAFEDKLRERLERGMRPLNSEQRDKLFGYDAPLGSLSAKISIAFALGILDDQMFRVAEMARAMRNACAHSRQRISFNDRALLNGLLFIKQELGFLDADFGSQPKFVFLLCTSYLIFSIQAEEKRTTGEFLKELIQSFATWTAANAETLQELRERRPRTNQES